MALAKIAISTSATNPVSESTNTSFHERCHFMTEVTGKASARLNLLSNSPTFALFNSSTSNSPSAHAACSQHQNFSRL